MGVCAVSGHLVHRLHNNRWHEGGHVDRRLPNGAHVPRDDIGLREGSLSERRTGKHRAGEHSRQ